MKAVFDTNILVDYLNEVSDAAREIAIRIVTWMEVMACPPVLTAVFMVMPQQD